MTSLFSAPALPKPAPLPAPLPPTPTLGDPAVAKARSQKSLLAAAMGNQGILTSPQGLMAPASTAQKTLLGV